MSTLISLIVTIVKDSAEALHTAVKIVELIKRLFGKKPELLPAAIGGRQGSVSRHFSGGVSRTPLPRWSGHSATHVVWVMLLVTALMMTVNLNKLDVRDTGLIPIPERNLFVQLVTVDHVWHEVDHQPVLLVRGHALSLDGSPARGTVLIGFGWSDLPVDGNFNVVGRAEVDANGSWSADVSLAKPIFRSPPKDSVDLVAVFVPDGSVSGVGDDIIPATELLRAPRSKITTVRIR
jgi:hypothetical protein